MDTKEVYKKLGYTDISVDELSSGEVVFVASLFSSSGGKRLFELKHSTSGAAETRLYPLLDQGNPFEVKGSYKVICLSDLIKVLDCYATWGQTTDIVEKLFSKRSAEYILTEVQGAPPIQDYDKSEHYARMYGASDTTIGDMPFTQAAVGGTRRTAQVKYSKTTLQENTMLDTIVQVNKTAAKEAATLAATRKLNEILVAKVATVVPESLAPALESPVGSLIVANIAVVVLELAEESMDYKTRDIARKVTKAMTQNAMADVIALLDLPALMDAVISMPEVQAVAGDFDEDDL